MRDTNTWRRWDNEHVWHPFTPMEAYRKEDTPIIASAEGFHLIDTEGRRYLDGVSSLWCNVHGHRVPEIDEAIKAQLADYSHSTLLGLAGVPSIKLAHELVQRAPAGLTKVFFSDDGATAVEAALKIAIQYYRQRTSAASERTTFLSLGGSYHGDTIGSVSVGGIDLFHGIYRNLLFSTIQAPSPVAYRTPLGMDAEEYLAFCFRRVEELLRENHKRIAAVIIEPLVQGAAGILVHPPGYLRRLRELTRELDILLIADEVAVGFGRTGTLFACEQEGVEPDLLCIGKGLTGGYLPVAATLAADEVFNAFLGRPDENRTFFHGHTFTGNALGCAAALAALKLFDERSVLVNVGRISALIHDRLSPLADHPHVGEIRQKGVMIGIELVADRKTKAAFPAAERRGHRVTLAARKRGVVLRPLGDVAVLMPAPAMPPNLVEELCAVAIASIDEATGRT